MPHNNNEERQQMVKIFTVDSPFENNVPSPEALARQARKWEAAEVIDYVLCGYSSLWPHNLVISPLLFAESSRVKLIVAHRPGVMHPAAAARCFATMDVMSGARLAINFVTGSSDKDVHREGDYADKATRYERAGEYVEVMKRCWSEPKSFDYQGEFYRAEAVRQLLRPLKNHVPVFMGGDSDAAIEFGARHADTYMLWGEPLAGTRERVERVLAAAEKHGRKPEFSLSLRLFLGDTDEAAWAAAHAAEDTILAAQGSNRFARSSAGDTSVGRERQLSLTNADVHDDCFWSGLVKLLGGFANSAALVGTPDRVMATLKQYHALGIGAFLFTGGADGLWEPSLKDFLVRVKQELQ
ncbi:LLM class flavin-dependent oxidoreductase [Pseudomonas citronellolis]|uniref:LLM class flavin-dependent oxidoreductase n=1 Tax=Pseudomonas citronellolis TaxID=53408 RepID=UPI00248E5C75|nr:LLM class flavin-dependent oxidoreductase [Pseudomonas citronellolis]